MGITGLLPFLEKATRPCHISEFRGGTVVVDTYCWLHQGANACAEELARGQDRQQYVYYCLKYVKMLLSYDIHPILVFDGRNLPAKAETEQKRREARKKARQRGAELLSLGKIEEARTYLRQCVDITPKMANNLVRECRKLNVDCIVAPYESDAQLAFFNLKGIAEVVITQDSDLVLFGCKQVLYKLDLSGAGQLVESEKIHSAVKIRPDQYSFEKFRHMCILSGCDYVDSLPGIGLKKAEKFLSKTVETNPEIFLDRIPRYLNMRNLTVTEEYKLNFMIAEATFKHQIVFDPLKKRLVPLTDPDDAGTKPEYCKNAGDIFDHEKAYQVALGNIDPYTFEKIDNWSPPNNISMFSIWSGICKRRISRKQSQELGKEQLSKFLTTTTVRTKTEFKVELVNEEQRKAAEDDIWEKELQIYKNPVIKTPPREEKEEIQEAKVSPILHRNPFLAKKKLSRFSLTETSSNIVVKSRYFVKPTENLPVYSPELMQADELVKPPEENKVIETEIINIEEENLNTQSDLAESCQNANMEIVEILDESETTCTKISLSQKSLLDGPSEAKRRKLGPCKTVGLKRSNSARSFQSSNQKTLQHFFSQFAKK